MVSQITLLPCLIHSWVNQITHSKLHFTTCVWTLNLKPHGHNHEDVKDSHQSVIPFGLPHTKSMTERMQACACYLFTHWLVMLPQERNPWEDIVLHPLKKLNPLEDSWYGPFVLPSPEINMHNLLPHELNHKGVHKLRSDMTSSRDPTKPMKDPQNVLPLPK